MAALERIIQEKIDLAVEHDLAAVTPGLCLQVVQHGHLKVDLRMGRTWRIYDLASLTKIIFTVPAVMQLYENRQVKLTTQIKKYLPEWPHKSTVAEHLSHSAGLTAWAPFYKKISSRKFHSENEKREFLRRQLYSAKTGSKHKAIYSDLDFILLGFFLEERFDRSLHDIWQSLIWREQVPGLHFNKIDLDGRSHALFKHTDYAPTENCPWRKKILQGEVHDDNTWSFGGVSTHAGLFGAPDDVTAYGKLLRASYRDKAQAEFLKPKTVQKFVRRAIPRSVGDFALGFMMPTKGSASCGHYFSLTSFGHTGFTGTSLWYDPKRDLLVTVLSNRVNPTRDNRKFVALRPRIHDIVVESLDRL